MRFDAGALSKNRNKSPVFRYLSNNPPRQMLWPKKWRDELGIFIATEGVSWRWIQSSFNMTEHRLHTVWVNTRHLHHLAKENIYSVTLEDAQVYMAHKPAGCEVPFWVMGYILDEIKSGKGWRPTARKWHVSHSMIAAHMRGERKNVLYFG